MNDYVPSVPGRPPAAEDGPSIFNTVGAYLGNEVSPIADFAYRHLRHGFNVDPRYSDPAYRQSRIPKEFQQETDPGFISLMGQVHNDEMMTSAIADWSRYQQNRKTLDESSFGSIAVATVLDPVNWVAVPIGLGAKGLKLGQAALRGGTAIAGIEAVREVGLHAGDPGRTSMESFMNIAGAAIFGGGLTEGVSALGRRNFAAQESFIKDYTRQMQELEDVSSLTREQMAEVVPAQQRGLGAADEAELRANAMSEDLEVSTPAQQELGFRQLDRWREQGLDPSQGENFADNWFVNSVFYKGITTPYKRIIQADIPQSVKEQVTAAFGDSGMLFVKNQLGKASVQSVWQRTQMNQRQWVQAMDRLQESFAKSIGETDVRPLDVNLSDLSREVSGGVTFGDWLDEVTVKGIKGVEDLDQPTAEALDIINDYFSHAKTRLEDAGLIRTKRGLEVRIERMSEEIQEITAKLEDLGLPVRENYRGDIEAFIAARREALDRMTPRDAGRVVKLESRRDNVEKSMGWYGALRDAPDVKDADLQSGSGMYLPRFWDKTAIQKNEAQFRQVLFDWYAQNPFVYEFNAKDGVWYRKDLSIETGAIEGRVDHTIKTILGEIDEFDAMMLDGDEMGRNRHFRSRSLNIPNELVTDFIHTNPLSVMRAYAQRVEPRIQYEEMFRRDYGGMLARLEDEMLEAGKSQKEINKFRRDYDALMRRVVTRLRDNPDTWDQKIAFVMREMAAFSYMGSAGISALPDFGRILMETDGAVMMKGISGLMDENLRPQLLKEVRDSASAVDILAGSAYLRLSEDMSNGVLDSSIWDRARNGFYILNGLAPITQVAKTLSGAIDSHMIVKYSQDWAAGKLPDQQIQWMARYGIDEAMAARIAKMPYTTDKSGLILANSENWLDHVEIPEFKEGTVKLLELNDDGSSAGKWDGDRYIPAFYRQNTNTIHFDREYIEGMFDDKPWTRPRVEGVEPLPEDQFKTPRQWANFVLMHEIMHTRFKQNRRMGEKKWQYENRINKLALDELAKTQGDNQDVIDTFRTAINSNVMNTIMMGTPADKPIMSDGVVHLPMHIAGPLGFKEDKLLKGYARVENAFLSLPFQFYSYTLATVNKTMGAMASGQLKSRNLGMAAMMGLGYLSLSVRTPDYIWSEMSGQDRALRAFDMSGIMPFYSDMFYNAMHTSLALGGPNITGGAFQPKFRQNESYMDAGMGFLGAGPSWTADVMGGIGQLVSGEFGEGARTIVRNAPGMRLWFIKNDVNQITNMWRE